MKRVFFLSLLLFLISAYLFLFNVSSASALTIVKCEISDPGSPSCNLCEAFKMISRGIRIALYVVLPGMAAFAFMLAGAFFLFAGGNEGTVKIGQGIIRVTIYGILIAFGGWIIVNTIMVEMVNPDVFNWWQVWYKIPECAPEATLAMPAIAQSDVSVGVAEDEPEEAIEETGIILTDTEARKRLLANDIKWNKKNCTTQEQTDCTSFDDIPAQTIETLVNIKARSGCDMIVTGGTEAGHKTHGKGKNVVDLRSNDCLLNYLSTYNTLHRIEKICTTVVHSDKSYNCNYNEPQEHIHIKFKKI